MSASDKKPSSFKSSMIFTGASMSGKRTVPVAPSSSAPPPSSSAPTLGAGSQKRKRPQASAIVFSQPQDTGTGRETMTQIAYAVAFLRDRDAPQTLDAVLSYLSLHNHDPEYQQVIRFILQTDKKVVYDPDGFGGRGSYAWRPPLDIRSSDQLLRYLQAQPTAQGLNVKDLLQGWPKAADAIRQLENQKKLLVARSKKDDAPKTVWADDPSLAQNLDTEFQDIWHKIRLPAPEDMRDELRKAEIMPTDKAIMPVAKAVVQRKAKKKPRRSGKVTNTHMQHILRDYGRN